MSSHMLSVIGAASAAVRSLKRSLPRSHCAQPADGSAGAGGLRGAGAGGAEGDRGARTQVLKSCIGQGYHGTHTPGRHPAQRAREPGLVHRLHALPGRDLARAASKRMVNFQTMVCDLTGMAIANGSSMLDEATAAAEADDAWPCAVGKSKSDDLSRGRRRACRRRIEVVRTRCRAAGHHRHHRPGAEELQAAARLHSPCVAAVPRPSPALVRDLAPLIDARHTPSRRPGDRLPLTCSR